MVTCIVKKIKRKEVAMMRGSPMSKEAWELGYTKVSNFFSCRIFGAFSRPKCFVNFLEWNIVYRAPPKLFDHRTYFL